jgi:glutamyl-tRNA synthetase
MVRVRFAPSPTGKLHVGNVRTALANILYARKHGGAFVVRMEDTDMGREVANAEQQILDDLAWLGMTPDEDPIKGGDFAPYRTNERTIRGDYDKALEKLFADGRAYECFVTKTELDLMRKVQTSSGQPPHYDNRHRDLSPAEKEAFRAQGLEPVIRFKLNDATIEWHDMVRGDVRYEAKFLGGDPVIIRSNGVPIFALAGAVDDINQEITHVVRGEDHVTNTAIQIQIFEALGGKVPVMAHMPMLLDSDGGKLSKRLDSLSVQQLKADGYLPKSILTYMSSLGFSAVPEVGTVDELAENFDFTKMGRSSVRFDTIQLNRVNAMEVRSSSYADINAYLEGFLNSDKPKAELSTFWDAVKGNIETLSELQGQYDLCYAQVGAEILETDDVEYIQVAAETLPQGVYSADTWNDWVSVLKVQTGRKGKQLFMPLRIALTGEKHGPEMASLLSVMGEEVARERLNHALGK